MTGAAAGVRAVVILSALDWGGLWQRPHHLARAWAEQGLRVLFVENTGARPPRLSDVPRILRRVRSALVRGETRARRRAEAVDIWSPVLLPGVGTVATAVNVPLAARAIHRWLKTVGLSPQTACFLTYLPTPLALHLMDELPWARTLYDVVADIRTLHPHLAAWEDRVLSTVTKVTSASHTLAERYAQRTGRQVCHIPDGFVNPPAGAPRTPPQGDRHVAVYLGGLNARVDLECLRILAEERPEWDLLIFGEVSVIPPPWFSRPNVRIRPPVARYEDLWPALIDASVGLVPYTRDSYTDGMHPAKLQEYLLAGLPVAATATKEMCWLRARWAPNTIVLAEGPSDFLRAVEEALSTDTPERRLLRVAWARTRPWGRVASELLAAGEAQVA